MRKAEQWAVCSGPHPHKWVHLASSVPSPLAYFKACPSHHISFSLIGISERKLSFRFNRSSLITLHLKFVQLFQTCIKWHGTDVWSGPSERMFLTNRRDLDQAWESGMHLGKVQCTAATCQIKSWEWRWCLSYDNWRGIWSGIVKSHYCFGACGWMYRLVLSFGVSAIQPMSFRCTASCFSVCICCKMIIVS